MDESERTNPILGRPLWAIFLICIALGDMGVRSVEWLFDRRGPPVNVEEVWWPFANAVLDGGDLYLAAWDNKPPLWEFLNLAVAAAADGNLTVYMLLFWFLIGFANGVTALLLWYLLDKQGHEIAGILAGLMYVVFLGVANGHQVDPRPFANVFIVVAFIVRSSYLAGLAIAAAGLLSQFAVFAIPPLLWYRLQISAEDWRWYSLRFCSAGLALVVIMFGAVAVIWSSDAAIMGWQFSVLSLGQYVGGYVERGLSVAGNPVGWSFYEARTIRDHLFWYIFAGVAIYAWHRGIEGYRGALLPSLAVAVFLLSTPRLIRQGPLYRFLPFVLLMALSAIGLQAFLRNDVLGRLRDFFELSE